MPPPVVNRLGAVHLGHTQVSFFDSDDNDNDHIMPLPPFCQPRPLPNSNSLSRHSAFSVLQKAKNRASTFLHDALHGRSRPKPPTQHHRALTEPFPQTMSFTADIIDIGPTRHSDVGGRHEYRQRTPPATARSAAVHPSCDVPACPIQTLSPPRTQSFTLTSPDYTSPCPPYLTPTRRPFLSSPSSSSSTSPLTPSSAWSSIPLTQISVSATNTGVAHDKAYTLVPGYTPSSPSPYDKVKMGRTYTLPNESERSTRTLSRRYKVSEPRYGNPISSTNTLLWPSHTPSPSPLTTRSPKKLQRRRPAGLMHSRSVPSLSVGDFLAGFQADSAAASDSASRTRPAPPPRSPSLSNMSHVQFSSTTTTASSLATSDFYSSTDSSTGCSLAMTRMSRSLSTLGGSESFSSLPYAFPISPSPMSTPSRLRMPWTIYTRPSGNGDEGASHSSWRTTLGPRGNDQTPSDYPSSRAVRTNREAFVLSSNRSSPSLSSSPPSSPSSSFSPSRDMVQTRGHYTGPLAITDLSDAVEKTFFSDDSDSDSGFGSVYGDNDSKVVAAVDTDDEELSMPSPRGGRDNPLATSDSDVWPDSDVEAKSVMVRSRSGVTGGQVGNSLKTDKVTPKLSDVFGSHISLCSMDAEAGSAQSQSYKADTTTNHNDKNPSISSITTDATCSSVLSALHAEVASVRSIATPLIFTQASSVIVSRRGSCESMAIAPVSLPLPTRHRNHNAVMGAGLSTTHPMALPHSLSWFPPSPFSCEFSSAVTSCNLGPDVDGETFDNWRSSYYSTGFPPDFEVYSAAFQEFAEKTNRVWAAGASGIVRRPRTGKGKRRVKKSVNVGSGRRSGGGGGGGGKGKRSGSRLRSAWYE